MATRKNTFLLKRSNVAGNIPTAGQIQLGELALNTADVKLYASGTTTNSILPIGWDRISRTGDTMTGTLYAPTISATTYQNLPPTDLSIGSNTGTVVRVDSSTGTDATLPVATASLAGVVTNTTQTFAGVKTFNNNVNMANTADLKFVDLAGTFPTSGKGFDWELNNDGARIYAIQPSSDSIDLVFQLRDNATTNDRFVFHVDDYQGPAFDKYPLIIRGGTEFDLVNSALYTNGTVRLSNAGVLQNVTGNISMFTNDSGYLLSSRTLSINGTTYDLTANRSWVVPTVTGGTYAGGTATFTNNTGGTFNVTGFSTGGGVSAFTYNNANTFTINNTYSATINTVTGFTVNGNLSAATIDQVNYIDFNTGVTSTNDVGRISWNDPDGTYNMGLYNGVTLQVGQEENVYGKASSAITMGNVVMYNGSQGDHVLLAKANPALTDDSQYKILGIATQDFATNQFGYVTTFGKVRELNTIAYSAGTTLYFNSTGTTTGGYTNVEPPAPYANVVIGSVLRSHATQGIILVRPSFRFQYHALEDVQITNVQNNDIVQYSGSAGYYVNTNRPKFTSVSATTMSASTFTGNLTGLASLATSATTALNSDLLDGQHGSYYASVASLNNYVPTGRTLSINGTSYDLSANRSWVVPTVTANTFNNATYDLTIGTSNGTNYTSNLGLLATDVKVTGGTYNINTGVVTFTNTTGGTFNVTGFTSGMTDTFVTGGTYSNGTATFTRSNGAAFNVTGFNTGTTVGNGTANYLARWTGSTALGNSLIRDDGSNIGINTAPSSSYKVSIYASSNSSALFVQNQATNANALSVYANGNGTQTGISAGAFGSASSDNTGIVGFVTDGNLAIGVKGYVNVSESGSVTNGVGGYFDGKGDGQYSIPTYSYSVQLVDGTEGVNKVLISKTNDGKANWSSSLSGLTSVSATTISATTFTGNLTGLASLATSATTALNATKISLTDDTTTNGNFPVVWSDSTNVVSRLFTDISNFTFNPNTNTLSVPNLTGTASLATSATTALNATNVGVTNNTSTNATYYLGFVSATSGNLPLQVDSATLTFNPSTNILTLPNIVATGTITATTISATTYLNLPTDVRVTGGTYSTGTATFRNNTGGTFTVTGFNTGTITGSGTDNFVPRFNGTSALENSIIYDNGSSIGINTTTPSYNLDINGNLGANRFYQKADGVPTNNLGDPTITEMALFDSQFDNKTAFYPLLYGFPTIIFETYNGVSWTDISSTITDTDKRKLFGGDNTSNIVIPNGVVQYQITISAATYVYLNALYNYWSSNGHNSQVQIWKKHNSGSWVQHTFSTATVSSWPGHLYLPFTTIPWHPAGALGTHYNQVRIVYTPTWSSSFPSNNINLYSLQLWGGYPASKRVVYATDELRNVSFPSNLTSTTLISTQSTGVSPLSVNSTTLVTNLNADYLDGQHGSFYYPASNPNGYTTNTGTVTQVNGGNGMNFTNFTTSGTITMGTPSSTTLASTNALTTNSHTHAFAPGGTAAQYITGAGALATFPTIPTVNDGTLTMATSGIATGSASFTANQAGTSTFTVNVPATDLSIGVSSGTQVRIDSSTGADVNIPVASTTLAGIVTTGTQTFSGFKTFTDVIQITTNGGSTGIGFDVTGSTLGGLSVNSSYFQFTAQASQGYLFKNYLGNNLLFLTTNGGAQFINSVTAGSFIKTGGTSTQFLKADGSVDSTTYVPTARTLTINGTAYDLSADRSWTITSAGFTGGTVAGATNFTGGLTANTISATTVTANNFTGLASLATSATTALNATNVGVTNNTTTNATYYLGFVSGTSGNQPLQVDSSTLTFNPSTNILTLPNIVATGTITATTISATTYQNLPAEIFVTGGTFSTGTATFRNNTGGTFTVTGFGTVTSVAALTLGTSGTDLSSTVANGTTTPVITLNVPDASATARGVINNTTQTIGGTKTFNSQLNGTVGSFSQSAANTTLYGNNGGVGGIGVSGGAGNGLGGYFVNNSSGTYPVLKLLGLSNTRLLEGRDTSDNITSAIFSNGNISGTSFIRTGGTSAQFLKADGTVDSTAYVPTARTLTINGTAFDLSANRSWTITSGAFTGGTVAGATNFTGGVTANTISATTVTANNFTGLASLATSATTALNATNVGVTNNTTTNATYYVTFASATSGNLPLQVDSSTLTFNPSTNTLTVANLSGLASQATSATTALNATNSTKIFTANLPTTDVVVYPTFVSGYGDNRDLYVDSNTLTYNPSSNILTLVNLVASGTITATTISATTVIANNFTGLASLATSATTALNSTNSTNAGITNNTTTNATYYPTFVSSTSGNLPLQVDSSTLTFNPATNTLTVANLAGLASLATSATTALNATNANVASRVTVIDDTSTNSNFPIVWADSTNTNARLYTDADRLWFNPSTDTLRTTSGVFTSSVDTSTLTASVLITGPTVSATTVKGVTISATTYLNLPTDVRVTGGTYSSGTATFTNNTGGTFNVTGFSTGGGGTFTGGTVTGPTVFTAGLTANTISATTITTPNITGLTNYVAKFTANGTFLGNSQIYDNGTNVGINTTSPNYPLHLYKASSETGILTSFGANNIYLSHGGWGMGAGKFGIGDGTLPTLVVDSGPNFVGINTTTPSQWLDVNGDALINGLTVGKGSTGVYNNVAFGASALQSNTTGYNNVAIHSALALNTTGTNNVGVGYKALSVNTAGSSNIAIGTGAMSLNTVGGSNISIGTDSFYNNDDGSDNLVIGNEALYTNTTGNRNMVIGNGAGYNLTGDGNLIIGLTNSILPDGNDLTNEQNTLSISKNMPQVRGAAHFWAPDATKVLSSAQGYILLANPNYYSAIFIDYSLEDQSGNLRAGTLKGIFTTTLSNIKWDEVTTSDIGSTVDYTFDFLDNGSGILGVELRNASTGPAVFCNYTSRLISRSIV